MTGSDLSHRAQIIENGRFKRSGASVELARDPTISEAYLTDLASAARAMPLLLT